MSCAGLLVGIASMPGSEEQDQVLCLKRGSHQAGEEVVDAVF